jgi:hypothetical protein
MPATAASASSMGDVLPQNQSMRRLCAALGFVEARSPLDDQLLRVSLPLRNPT